MTLLQINIPSTVYEQLRRNAQSRHISVESMIGEWVVQRASQMASSPPAREALLTALRDAGLQVVAKGMQGNPLSPAEREALASQIPPGRSLADIVIEERGTF